MNDRALLELLGQLEEEIAKESEPLAEILAGVRNGDIPDGEAVRWIMQISEEDPKAKAALTKAASRLPEDKLLTHNPINKLPRLNPLVEAAVIERLQFDGDAPELRSGPLAPGRAPAVSVETTARNPVAIGKMLQNASVEMQQKVERHDKTRLQKINTSTAALQKASKHGELLLMQDDYALDVIRQGSADTDYPGYKRGQVPAPMKAKKVTGAGLATMTKKDREKATWQTVATTQGRRSATPVIQQEMIAQLKKLGFTASTRVPSEGNEKPSAATNWSIDIPENNSLHPNFSFLDIAARALVKGLVMELKDKTVRSLVLETAPLQQIDERKVGWYARLYEVI